MQCKCEAGMREKFTHGFRSRSFLLGPTRRSNSFIAPIGKPMQMSRECSNFAFCKCESSLQRLRDYLDGESAVDEQPLVVGSISVGFSPPPHEV